MFRSRYPDNKLWYSEKLKNLKDEYKSCSINEHERKRLLRNVYCREIKIAKKEFVQSESSKNAKKGVWGILNKRKSEEIKVIESEGRMISDKKELAVLFEKHFREKVESLRKDPRPQEAYQIMEKELNGSGKWDLHECSMQDISKIIDELKPNTSRDADGLSYFTLKTFKQ